MMYVSRTRTRLKVCPNKDLNYYVCVADQNKAKGLFKQGFKLLCMCRGPEQG